MVTPALREGLSWLAPSPTWADMRDLGVPANREDFLRPAVLRFGHDSFMDELLNVLAYHPQRLGEWRAIPETWEKPMPAPSTAAKLALTEPVSALSLELSRFARRKELLATGAALVPVSSSGRDEPPLKLYQPLQLRHYLVTASLVCQRPGLPDRRVDPGKQERGAFVLRRILLPDGIDRPADDPREWNEYAFVQGPSGAVWQQVNDAGGRAERLLPGEERMPLFSLGFDEAPDRKRRVFGGVIPVGRREAYVAAGVRTTPIGDAAAQGTSAETEPQMDSRRLMFEMQVTGPWNELVRQTMDKIDRVADTGNLSADIKEAFDNKTPPPPAAGDESVARSRDQAQTISWYALLDFERFLSAHLPGVHDVLADRRSRSDLKPNEELLVAFLEHFKLDAALQNAGTKPHLLQALTELARNPSIGVGLEAVDVAYEAAAPEGPDGRWPAFRFPLADVLTKGPFPFSVDGVDLGGNAAGSDATLARAEAALTKLAELVEGALPARDGVRMPEIHIQTRPQFDSRAAWFAIRCIYERPNCGPFDPPVVSEPTRPFQFAGFFDSDAPVRPARIPLPFDISPAGLRKFPKGATLMISDMLCGQLKRIRKLTLGDLVLSVLPWPFHKDLPRPDSNGPCADSRGEFCSLSIPIVTLCALILLIILVALFDIFFKWLPLLFFCFPLKLAGKRR